MTEAIEPALIVVPGGEFEMGDDRGLPDQRPAHRVRVGALAVARFAVTRREYELFCLATDTPPPPSWLQSNLSGPRQPAVGISWFEATEYARWLSIQFGRTFRLPTEAERERAARGLVEGCRFPWGDADSPEGGAVPARTAPTTVDDSLPNALGLHGMADGVHEWCLDWYDPGWYGKSPADDPQGPPRGTRRVSRGGSWRHAHATTPCAARSSLPPAFHYTDYGFRIVSPGETDSKVVAPSTLSPARIGS